MNLEEPIILSEFLQYLDRDLVFLDGMAQGLDCTPLKSRIQGMRKNLKDYIESNNLRGILPWLPKSSKPKPDPS